MSDFLTVLVSDDDRPMTKRFEGACYAKREYQNAYTYAAFTQPVDGIVSLSEALTELERVPTACVIRGELIPGTDPTTVVRRKDAHGDGVTPCFRECEAGHHWMMADFDKVPVIGLTTNEERLAHLVAMLPMEFHDVSYHYQWSSSAGIGGWDSLSCHIWFWLSEPWTDRLLIARVQSEGWEIDESPLRTVQPNYTAAPIFVDCDDPLGRERSGLVRKYRHGGRGWSDEVRLRPWLRPAEVSVFAGSTRVAAQAPKSFQERLADIGPRYHGPINSAIACYVATVPDFDRHELLDLIRDAIMAGAPGSNPKRVYLNDRYLNASIDGAVMKFRKL